jgi:ketosteroid isomerase-like protein
VTDAALVDAFARAIARGDADGLRALCAPDAVFWLNLGPVEMPAAERLALIERERAHTRSMAAVDVRVTPTADGFVVQQTSVVTMPSGDELRIPVCVLVTVRDGRVTRVDEYADSAAAGPLIAALFEQ